MCGKAGCENRLSASSADSDTPADKRKGAATLEGNEAGESQASAMGVPRRGLKGEEAATAGPTMHASTGHSECFIND